MSGAVFLVRDDRAVITADGGSWTLWEGQYHLTSVGSKIITLPNLNMAFAGAGCSDFPRLLHFNHSSSWSSFDDAIDRMADDARAVFSNMRFNYPNRRIAWHGMIVGFSEKRSSFEMWELDVHDELENRVDLQKFVGEIAMLPEPSREAYERVGLMGENGNVNISICHVRQRYFGLAQIMQAQRYTKRPMGIQLDPPPEGCVIAGFIEQVVISRDFLMSSIVHRYNDPIDAVVDPEHNPLPRPERINLEINNG